MSTRSRRLPRRAAAFAGSHPLTFLAVPLILLAVPGALGAVDVKVTAAAGDDMEVVPCPIELNLGTDYLETPEWSTEELARYRCRWYEGVLIRRVETDLDDRRLRVRVTMEQRGGSDVEVKLHVSLLDGGEAVATQKKGVEVDGSEKNREALRLRMGRDELLETRPELVLGIDRIEND